MEINDKSFLGLEKRCKYVFVPMRERISYRHLYNFTIYIYHSRESVRNKMLDVDSFRHALKEDSFKYVKIENLGIKKFLFWKLLMTVSFLLSPLIKKREIYERSYTR